MGDILDTTKGRRSEGHFATCSHDSDCCQAPASMPIRIGKHWATALSGFIAGAATAAIILVPWLYVQGRFCGEEPFRLVNPILGDQPEFAEDGTPITPDTQP